MNRFALHKLVKHKFGLKSVEASNGKESLDKVKDLMKKRKSGEGCTCPGLRIIFMDLEMPVMDGIEVRPSSIIPQ